MYVNTKGEVSFERPYKPKICLGVNASLVRNFEMQGFVHLWFAKWLDKIFYQRSEDRFQQKQVCYDKRNDNSLSS